MAQQQGSLAWIASLRAAPATHKADGLKTIAAKMSRDQWRHLSQSERDALHELHSDLTLGPRLDQPRIAPGRVQRYRLPAGVSVLENPQSSELASSAVPPLCHRDQPQEAAPAKSALYAVDAPSLPQPDSVYKLVDCWEFE